MSGLISDVELTEIVQRAQKLKALADRGGTVHEAAAAAAKLQELLTRYNLAMHDLELETRKKTVFVQSGHLQGVHISAHLMWEVHLISGLCRMNFCRCFFTKQYQTPKKAVTLYGEEHNIRVVTLMYQYLYETIKRLADEYYTTHKARGDLPVVRGKYDWDKGTEYYSISAKTWKNNFCEQARITVLDRLRAQRRQQEESVNSTTAIVRVIDKELETTYRDAFPDLSKRKWQQQASNYSKHARQAGREAGEQIGLDPQVQHGTSAKQLR